MKLLIDLRSEFEGVQFSLRDYCIASLSLNVSIDELRVFSKQLKVIDDIEYFALTQNETQQITKSFILFQDKILVLFPDVINWSTLITAYALSHSTTIDESLIQEIKDSLEFTKLNLQTFLLQKDKYESDLKEHKYNLFRPLEFFDAEKLVLEFEDKADSVKIVSNKVVVSYKNIKIGNDVDGYLTYNDIIVFISKFRIDGFLLRFDNFDYSSYWNFPIILHPVLSVPYGRNNILEFIPANNYSIFAEVITETVKDNSNSMAVIIEDFQMLRKLWNQNKVSITDRLELSKAILRLKQDL